MNDENVMTPEEEQMDIEQVEAIDPFDEIKQLKGTVETYKRIAEDYLQQAEYIGQLQDKLAARQSSDSLTMDCPGYEDLGAVLMEAYMQAAVGKGDERHANGLPFADQPMQMINQMVGPGFSAGQAMKKIQEAQGLCARGDADAGIRELLGAIVYTAGTIMAIQKLTAGQKGE